MEKAPHKTRTNRSERTVSMTGRTARAACYLLALAVVAGLWRGASGHAHRRSVAAPDEPTTEAPGDDNAFSADELRELARGMMRDATKKLFPYVQDLAYDQNLPHECISSLFKLGRGIRSNKLWAFKFLDAMGRPPAGLLEGSTGALGAYDECLDISVPDGDEPTSAEAFRGQYCTLYVKPELTDRWLGVLQRSLDQYPPALRKRVQNVTQLRRIYDHWLVGGMRLGICLPSQCSGKDLKYMVDRFAKPFRINTKVSACAVQKPVTFTTLQLCLICMLSVLGLLVLAATSLELWLMSIHRGCKKNPDKPLCLRLVLTFSVVDNTRTLFKRAGRETEAHRLRCLHGIRVISYLWITLCHTYAIMDPHVAVQGMRFLDYIDGFAFTVVVNGMLSVETFFIMSGFLVGIGIFNEVEKKKSIWFLIPVTAVMRYIRLTVPGVFLVAVFFLYPLVVSGPLVDDMVQYLVNVCHRNWWHVLTHVSNLRNPVDVCLPTLWYIACDYQLFLTTLLLVFLLAKKPVAGVLCLVTVALGACIAVGVQHYLSAFEPLPYTHITDIDLFFKGHAAMYLWPTGHLTSFVAGVLAAFCFHKYSHVKFGRVTYAVCWLLSVVGGLAVVYSVFAWNHSGVYVQALASTYAGLQRLVWATAICWVVFVCATGQAVLVNRLLSLDVFVPLSRLTYCGYLVQMLVISTRLVTLRHSVYYTHWPMVRDYLGHTVLIYMFAYLMYLLCECPAVKLSKMALNGVTRAITRGAKKGCQDSVNQNCCRL